MLNSRPGARSRHGAVLVLFAAGLVTLVCMMALAIDVGYLYVLKARVQSVADVAALTAARALKPVLPLEPQRAVVVDLTRRIMGSNGLEEKRYDVRIDPAEPNTGAEPAVILTIAGDERAGSFFSRILGRNGFNVAVGAKVRAMAPGGVLQVVLVE